MMQYEENYLYTPEETQAMINSGSRTYNYYTYENQVDHYQQDHYELHFSHKFDPALNLNLAAFYIHGSGYYENYKNDQDLAAYRIPYPVVGPDTIFTTDLVNRKWLDNDFYGFTFALNHKKNKHDFTLGGGWNEYVGNHFGKVIWGRYLGEINPNREWYRGKGIKKDANIFAKYNLQVINNVNLFADVQNRLINYTIKGIDADLRDVSQQHNFNFFNPKVGIFYQPNETENIFFSFAVANREPNRDNYVDADPKGKQPIQETLYDWELGYKFQSTAFTAGANLYYMNYKNQLVLTGEINDVGAPIMVNVDKSYRSGIELQGGWKISRILQWNINATFSQNKIRNFTEYVDDWDNGGQQAFDLGTTDIAFSPNIIANSLVTIEPLENLQFSLVSSYVSKQFIDNTSNSNRILNAYFVHNFQTDYSFKTPIFSEITLHLQVNNLLDEKYESNAWVYSYIYEGQRFKMDGYFPQAGTNVILGMDFKF